MVDLKKINWFTLLPLVTQAVTDVEALQDPNLSSDEKKAKALDLVKQAVQGTELVTGLDLFNDEEFVDAISELVDTAVRIANLAASKSSKPSS